MTNRITLAMNACAGLTDEELEARGKGSFAKMINRKRQYAAAARSLKASSDVVGKEFKLAMAQLQKAQEELAKAQATIAALEALDAPVGDTSEADAMLSEALKKSAH